VYQDSAGSALLADPGDRLRLILTTVNDWTVMVLVAASVGEFEAFSAEAATLIQTIRFVPDQGPGT
jgi:hypothetical protein